MTGFTGDARVVVQAVPIQGTRILGKTGIRQLNRGSCGITWIICQCRNRIIAVTTVTGTALGFICPRFTNTTRAQFELTTHRQHTAMTVITFLACGEHGAAETLGNLARMAVEAVLLHRNTFARDNQR